MTSPGTGMDADIPSRGGSFHTISSGSRLLGFISIDSTIGGRARGGLRIAEDLSEEEIRSASRAMTLKYGLLGLPQGGAKAGVIGEADAPAPDKRRMLHEFASTAGRLLRDRTYIPDADIGTSTSDIRAMMESIGIEAGPREWVGTRSGDYTARSCLAAASAVVERTGGSLAGCRVAIEGFGNVGSPLARLLADRGATVVAISTSRGAVYRDDGLDVKRLTRRALELGSRVVEEESDAIDREALLELPVDILFPCARFQTIHTGNVERIAARAICAGANGPVCPEAERVLFERGIPYPPDFLTNCGGVLGGTLEFAGVPFGRIGAFIEEQLRPRVSGLLDDAERMRVAPRSIAEPRALERHAHVRRQVEHPGPVQRLWSLGLEAYRRRYIPKGLVSRLAPARMARLMT